jgi:rod shape-determining protein MreC
VSTDGKKTDRLSESALAVLPLVFYLGLAVALMVADRRMDYGRQARERAAVVSEPLWWVASAPVRLFRAAGEELSLRSTLQAENERRKRELDIATARIHRLNAIAEENRRLRDLLGGTRGYALDVRLVGILDVDLDPFRQRIVLDAGSDEGVRIGQALIDSGGVLGQVIEVGPNRSTALLITDPDHAVPVQVARSGLRTIAYGTGHSDRLLLPNVPQSGDIRRGDLLISSGLGGRFPAGFPVGTVTALQADKLRLFVTADATPAAHLERGSEVLLVSNRPAPVDVGPPAPPHANQPGPLPEEAAEPAHGPAAPATATAKKPAATTAASAAPAVKSAAPASRTAVPQDKPAPPTTVQPATEPAR